MNVVLVIDALLTCLLSDPYTVSRGADEQTHATLRRQDRRCESKRGLALLERRHGRDFRLAYGTTLYIKATVLTSPYSEELQATCFSYAVLPEVIPIQRDLRTFLNRRSIQHRPFPVSPRVKIIPPQPSPPDPQQPIREHQLRIGFEPIASCPSPLPAHTPAHSPCGQT